MIHSDCGFCTQRRLLESVAERIQRERFQITRPRYSLSAYGPLSDEARAHVQASVETHYGAFVAAVARGRGTTQKQVREGMGQGRVLLPEDALDARMIDGVATLAQVIAKVHARTKRVASSGGDKANPRLAAMMRDVEIAKLS